MGVMHRLIDRNQEFVSRFRHGEKAGAPAEHLAVLTCMDARIHLTKALGLDIGDANIVRNAGGRASDDAIRSLVISTELLGASEIAVMHHTDCGMLKFTNDDLRKKLSAERGVDASGVDFLPFPDVEQSVRDDVATLEGSPLLADGIEVTGWIYDVRTGTISPVT
ncbi:MAG TPA: carbonic anhydrase [Acidimicrobiia bacterium]|nr:carbonic anhydrase [Acidimicrobiia bacterium]